MNLGYEWVGLKASRSVQVIDGLWFDVRTKELRLYLPAKEHDRPLRLLASMEDDDNDDDDDDDNDDDDEEDHRQKRRGRASAQKKRRPVVVSHPAARDFRWLVLVDVQQYRVVARPVDLTTHDLWRVPPWKTAAAGAAAAAIATSTSNAAMDAPAAPPLRERFHW